MSKRSVFIVGAGGMVGSAAAQALAIKEIASDIVLIDVAEELVRGQAMDINHATAYTNGVRVRVGDYSDIKDNDIVVVTSGAAQKPEQTRLELIGINAAITRDVVGRIAAQGKDIYLMMVANPVDVLTYIAATEFDLPPGKVFGTGTTLDTARLRVALANDLHVSQRHVHAYILGEHGDSSFPALSNATISGMPLVQFPGFDPNLVETIDHDIRRAAYEIIAAKKATNYGIGHVVAQLVGALARDTHSVYPVCSLVQGQYGIEDVVLGLPSLVSAHGIEILDNYPLSGKEVAQLQHSAAVVKKVIGQLTQPVTAEFATV